MRISIPYKNHFKLNDIVDEFSIFFDPDKNSFDTLIEFIQKFKDKQINIEYRNGIDTKTAAALAKIGGNVHFCLRAEDIQKSSALLDRGCKIFFDNSMAANSWNMLFWLVEHHRVCDVYICDDLMYELDKVREYCTEHDVRIRMVANRAPTSYPITKDMYTMPLYRPQDMEILEKYIDVVEFDCGSPYNFDMLKVLYKNYIKKRFWYGQLSEINIDFKDYDMPCPGLTWALAEKRSCCGLRCRKGGKCNTCKLLITLAQSLRDIGAQLAT